MRERERERGKERNFIRFGQHRAFNYMSIDRYSWLSVMGQLGSLIICCMQCRSIIYVMLSAFSVCKVEIYIVGELMYGRVREECMNRVVWERERDGERKKERDGERKRERERKKEREMEKERSRVGERKREREGEREKERKSIGKKNTDEMSGERVRWREERKRENEVIYEQSDREIGETQ